jgi:hypothetical protein
VRIHENLKSLTVEELEGQKRDLHLAAFRCLLAETERELNDAAEEPQAQYRLQRDGSRVHEGGTFTLEGLVGKVMGECEAVLKRQAAVRSERYAPVTWQDLLKHCLASIRPVFGQCLTLLTS